MQSHEMTLELTIGNGECEATVNFDFFPAYIARAPRGEYRPLEPDEPAHVVIEKITLHAKDPKRSVVLVEGLLFDLLADDWLEEQCLDFVTEDA